MTILIPWCLLIKRNKQPSGISNDFQDLQDDLPGFAITIAEICLDFCPTTSRLEVWQSFQMICRSVSRFWFSEIHFNCGKTSCQKKSFYVLKMPPNTISTNTPVIVATLGVLPHFLSAHQDVLKSLCFRWFRPLWLNPFLRFFVGSIVI